MKIAIFTDLHAGIKKGNQYFVDKQKEFIDKLINDCEENNIEVIFFLGDFIDNRRFVDISILQSVIDYFFQKVEKSETIKKIFAIVGNHDMYRGNSFEFNFLSYIEKYYEKLRVVDTITKIKLNNKKMILTPYLHKNNFKEFDEAMESSYDYCFGHFNVSDFYNHYSKMSEKLKRSLKSADSLSLSHFANIKIAVFSGHIHLRAEKENFVNVGSPLQYSYEQAGSETGYYVLDLETDKYEFVSQPAKIFHKFKINEMKDFEEFEQKKESYYNTYTLLIIGNKLTEKEVEKIQDRIRIMSDMFEHLDFIDNNIVDDIAMELEKLDDDEYLQKIESFLRDENVLKILDEFIDIHFEMSEEDKLNISNRFNVIYNTCLSERK